MITIKGSNVTAMVSNMDAAVKFYTEILGLKLKSRYDDHWAEVEAPGITIGLHPRGKEVHTGDNLSIAFSVDDIRQTVALLEPKGIQFRIVDDTQVLLALFTDPDGNELYFVQSEW